MTERVAVVDFGGGNLASAARGLEAAAAAEGLDSRVIVTGEPNAVRHADRIVLPGQGAFADCAAGLRAIPGLWDAIRVATDEGTPYLGICVGMQLMAQRGLEHAVTQGFGWITGNVARMPDGQRLPHMGWNSLAFSVDYPHPLLAGVAPGADVYFVHSYAMRGAPRGSVIATTEYGGPVVAMVADGNRAGTQFHVEKSQAVGLRILRNFLRWTPPGAHR